MPQSTEAACLLQTGTMYSARVGLRGGSGEDVFFGIKQGGFSLYFGDEPIYHVDFEGRWQRAFIEGIHYLKGLDASVRAIGRGREDAGLVLRRRVLGPGEVREIDETIRRATLDLMEGLGAGRLAAVEAPPTIRTVGLGEVVGFLERVASWDAAAWLAHRHRYEATYGAWPFLPPDCPGPIVLQATQGHAFGLGGPSEEKARSSQEFEEHVSAVETLLGRRASQCRDIFLGGADVLRQPTGLVVDYLETIGSRVSGFLDPGPSRAGIVHALLDDFRPPLPDLGDWQRLKAGRLGRVTLGVESGDPSIRETHGKSWTDDELRKTVANLKGAGIGVGLVVMIGVGGRSRVAAHLESTARLIRTLPLADRDLISVIDAGRLGLSSTDPETLSDADATEQLASLKTGLMAGWSSKGPRVVLYNPDKQWA